MEAESQPVSPPVPELPTEPPPAPPRRPRIWPVFVGMLAAIALGIAGTIAVVIAVAVVLGATGGADRLAETLPDRLQNDPLLLLAQMLPFALSLGVVALAAPRIERRRVADALGLARPGLSAPQWLLLILGSMIPFALGIGCAALMPTFGGGEKIVEMWRTMPPATAVAWVLLIGLVPGFCEEMFFRGFMQRRLLSRWRPPAAIGVTSLCFAIMHVDPATAAMAFVLGVWLGVVAWRTDSIRPTIAIHTAINSSWNAAQILLGRSEATDRQIWLALGSFLVVCAACFAASIVLLRRRGRPAEASPLAAI